MVTKKIPVAVVSIRMVDALDREKISFPKPEDGAAMVKFWEVAVPAERYERPLAERTDPEDEIASTYVLTGVWRTPEESAMTAPYPFLSTIAPVADMAIRRPWIEVRRENRLAITAYRGPTRC